VTRRVCCPSCRAIGLTGRAALPQASVTLGRALSGRDVFVVALLFLALVAAVALTAVWLGDTDRRKAAIDVLDRLIRWRL
jgi:hypothetical protein